MSRTYFAGELDSVATWWRIYRRDGVTLGFTAHNRDLVFGGIRHRAAPGMVPSAIRLSMDFGDDEASVEGALSHGAIGEDELAAGAFDGATVETGVVDWTTLENTLLYSGTIAAISRDGPTFSAELQSRKAAFARDPIPRTGPSCRATFCGPGCDLPPLRYEARGRTLSLDRAGNTIVTDIASPALYLHGMLRFTEGPQAGQVFTVLDVSGTSLLLDRPLADGVMAGLPLLLRQGCDRTIATCAARFGNAVNFRGEPFVPGADLLTQYPVPR